MIPRRNYIDQMTSGELAIRDAIIAVEKVGAHPLLTDAVVLLGQAKDKVSDYIDLPKPEGFSEKVARLQREIGERTAELQSLVCGDPRQSVYIGPQNPGDASTESEE